MKKLITICAVVGMILAVSGAAQAELIYEFNPNNLINQYTAGPPLSGSGSANPRAMYSGPYSAYEGVAAWNAAGENSDMDNAIESDYLGWRDNEGGYITQFNTWFMGNATGHGWGEELVVKSDTTGANITATAADGWSVSVIDNPWYDDCYMVEWTADNVANALKINGPDIGNFSFTADLYVDTNGNGWDETDLMAVAGEDYTVWFGGYGVGTNSFSYDDESIDPMYQGTLDITAAVPEPATVCLLGIGALSLIRRKRKA